MERTHVVIKDRTAEAGSTEGQSVGVPVGVWVCGCGCGCGCSDEITLLVFYNNGKFDAKVWRTLPLLVLLLV